MVLIFSVHLVRFDLGFPLFDRIIRRLHYAPVFFFIFSWIIAPISALSILRIFAPDHILSHKELLSSLLKWPWFCFRIGLLVLPLFFRKKKVFFEVICHLFFFVFMVDSWSGKVCLRRITCVADDISSKGRGRGMTKAGPCFTLVPVRVTCTVLVFLYQVVKKYLSV